MPKTKPNTAAVGYIRMSSDKQDASPDRQRAEIKKTADAHGLTIVKWYEDHGISGTASANRDSFQSLMEDAKSGGVRAVVLHEQSRLSREHPLDALEHLNKFRKLGVRLISSLRGEVNFKEISGLIMSLVDAHGAHDESIKMAIRSVGGRRVKSLRGDRCAGGVFGYDRELIDDSGEIVRRVHFRERFSKPKSWRSVSVVSSDIEAVDTLREAFQNVAKGQRVSAQVNMFNERGVKTMSGLRFSYNTLMKMLRNPLYRGTLRAGHYSKGKFARIDQDGIIEVDGAHEALISPDLFDKVQVELDRRKRGHRGKTPGRYLLGSRVRCLVCGGTMYGALGSNGSREPVRYYRCGAKYKPRAKTNHTFEVMAEPLESYVLTTAREVLLTEETRGLIKEGAEDSLAPADEYESRAVHQRDGLVRNIARAEENLALAEDPKDFRSISAMLRKWRDDLEELNARIVNSTGRRRQAPEAIVELARLEEHGTELGTSDALRLSQAIGVAIDRINIGRRTVGSDTKSPLELHGEIHFSREVSDNPPVEFTEPELGIRRVWRDVVEFVRGFGKPVDAKQVAEKFGFSTGMAIRHLKAGSAAEMVKYNGYRKGWSPLSEKA